MSRSEVAVFQVPKISLGKVVMDNSMEVSLRLSAIADADNEEFFKEEGGYGDTPLFLAVRCCNNEGVLQSIIDKVGVEADILEVKDEIYGEGSTLLHVAVEAGNYVAINLLVEYGFDINSRNDNDETPISIALEDDRLDLALSLIEMGGDISIRDLCAIIKLASDKVKDEPGELGRYEGIINRLKICFSLNIDTKHLLLNPDFIRYIPALAAKSEEYSDMASSATLEGSTDAELLDGMVAEEGLRNNLRKSIKNNDLASVKTLTSELIRRGVDIGRIDYDMGYEVHNPLTYAISLGRREVIEYLATISDVNPRLREDQDSALWYSIMMRDQRTLAKLIQYSYPLDEIFRNGENALTMAIKLGFGDIANLILNNGYRISDQDAIKYLFLIADFGSEEFTETAKSLARRVDVNLCELYEYDIISNAIGVKKDWLAKALTKEDEIAKVNSNISNAIMLSTGAGDNDFATLLINYQITNSQPLSPEAISLIAASEDFSEILPRIESESSKEDLSKFIKFSKLKYYLGLSYSHLDYRTFTRFVMRFIEDAIPNIDPEVGDYIGKALSYIQYEQPLGYQAPKKNVTAFVVPFKEHAAFFVINYLDDGITPHKISYCNAGEGVLSNTHGVAIFEIDQTKLAGVGNLSAFLHHYFEENNFKLDSHDKESFLKKMSEIAVCDEDGGCKLTFSIPTKIQTRGNCALKSTNLAIREILRITSRLEFLTDESGKSCGSGYDIYKKYRNGLKELFFIDLVELLKDPMLESMVYYEDLKNLTYDLFHKSITKKEYDLSEILTPFIRKFCTESGAINYPIAQNGYLFSALESRDLKAMELFLEAGMSAQFHNIRGETPLGFAALHGNIDAVKLLLPYVDPNFANLSNIAPLFLSIANSHQEISKMLIEDVRTNIVVWDSTGSTPLHLAIKYEDFEAAKMLIARKVAVNFPNIHGETPISIATYRRNGEMLKLMNDTGMKINDEQVTAFIDHHKARARSLSESARMVPSPSAEAASSSQVSVAGKDFF